MKKKKSSWCKQSICLVVEKTGFETSSMSSHKFAVVFFFPLISSSSFFFWGGGGWWGGGPNYAFSIQQFWLKCQYFMLMIFKQEFLN